MPTGRGYVCLTLGGIAIAAGWFLGLVEMYVIGATLVALVVVAIIVAALRPLRLGVARTINPTRLHVGTVGRVELAIRNGANKTPVMRMTDHVHGTSGAQLFISPLRANEVTRAAYRLPTERRGIVTVGPVDFESTDAFGLTSRSFRSPTPGQLVVYPEVVPLPPAPPAPASNRKSNSDHPEFLGGRSEEFHALRHYVPGDDIRRINWAASARHDDLVVREDEAPTQNHLTVFLDNAAIPPGIALDRAASVAASLVTSMRNRSDPFRLATVDGLDTGYVLGPSGLDRALGILAVVDTTAIKRGEKVQIDNAEGALVMVSTEYPKVRPHDLGNFGRVLLVSLAPSVWDESAETVASTADAVGNDVKLLLGSINDLGPLWRRAIATLLNARISA
ncbi:MAG: DUF58 domain-containing protein [Acidimicrobiia bacterium]|nr:DUF58 domain-containing protein [Acidimicrobiia bacterium]